MSRDISAAMLAALGTSPIRAVLLLDAEFINGWLYLHTGYGDMTWGGHVYQGIGQLIALSAIEETGEVRATGLTATLAGLDQGITSIALQELAQNKAGIVRLGLQDSAGAWIGDGPEIVFSGKLDVGTVREEAGNATVTINYESRLVNLETPRRWAWTDQDQQTTYPGDLGCKQTGTIADQILQWG